MCSRVGLLVASGVVPPDLSSAWTEVMSMSSSLLVYSNVIVDAGELDLDGDDSIFQCYTRLTGIGETNVRKIYSKLIYS